MKILSTLFFFSQPLHLTLVRGAMPTLNELPGTSKSSSIFCCFFLVFLCPCFIFPGNISQLSSSSSTFIIQNMVFLDGGGEREWYFVVTGKARMSSKHLNMRLTLLWNHLTQSASSLTDMTQRGVWFNQYQTVLLWWKWDQTPFPGPHCIALKYHSFQEVFQNCNWDQTESSAPSGLKDAIRAACLCS